VDSISTTVKELEQHGYIIRERIRNSKGQLTTIEYTILEQPKPPLPKQEKPAQLNTKKSSNQKSTTDLSSTEQSNPYEPQAAAGIGMDTRETIGNYCSALKFLLTLLHPCSRIKSLHGCSIIVADVRQ